MRKPYIKTVENGYILGIATNAVGTEITEAEYNEILSVIRSVPTALEGYGYRLKEDLTWEEYKLPEAEETEEITDAEALGILLGGAV